MHSWFFKSFLLIAALWILRPEILHESVSRFWLSYQVEFVQPFWAKSEKANMSCFTQKTDFVLTQGPLRTHWMPSCLSSSNWSSSLFIRSIEHAPLPYTFSYLGWILRKSSIINCSQTKFEAIIVHCLFMQIFFVDCFHFSGDLYTFAVCVLSVLSFSHFRNLTSSSGGSLQKNQMKNAPKFVSFST